jgi:DNA-binding NtrC family response regulator
VGADRPVKVDVRIVAATNRNLQKEVEGGTFRQDLYYRLAVLRVVLPPLRRRTEDIPLLVSHFLADLTPAGQKPVQVAYETIVKLRHHKWPGNVRELRNFVERAAMLATDNRLETRYLLPPSFGDTQSGASDDAPASVPVPVTSGDFPPWPGLEEDLPFKDAKARLIDVFERAYWTRLLERTHGNVSAAARIAGIHRKSAEYLLKKLELRDEEG